MSEMFTVPDDLRTSPTVMHDIRFALEVLRRGLAGPADTRTVTAALGHLQRLEELLCELATSLGPTAGAAALRVRDDVSSHLLAARVCHEASMRPRRVAEVIDRAVMATTAGLSLASTI